MKTETNVHKDGKRRHKNEALSLRVRRSTRRNQEDESSRKDLSSQSNGRIAKEPGSPAKEGNPTLEPEPDLSARK